MTAAVIRDALAWRLRRLVGDERVDGTFVRIAHRWRPVLTRPVFVGIAGSAGKTTTKELLVRMLSGKKRGRGNPASLNALPEVAKTLLRARPTDDFCVAELDETRPGELGKVLTLLRPAVGIVTVVGTDHWSAYGSRSAIAAELSQLVASLPSSGTAVLNADDEWVLAMAARCSAPVITFGTSPVAELRAENITSTWPDRLTMTLVRGAARSQLHTKLCGKHWVPSVLGAIGGGLALGLTLDECAERLATIDPLDGRMQPVTTSDGITFIRDDFKAPLWALESCFEFMRAARAERKIIVIGMLSDVGPDNGLKYAKIAAQAQEIADFTVFVGPWASSVLKTRKPGREDALRAFGHVHDAAEYVNSVVRRGDLVLLKGTNKQDHLLRIILARSGSIACWRSDCARDLFCNECPDRNKRVGLTAPTPMSRAETARETETKDERVDADEQVIVGLGNPHPKYAETPHNVGHAVVDQIAKSLHLTWDTTPGAWIARGSSNGQRICLIKVRTAMNTTGEALKQLAARMSFEPDRCILVHDDLDMPIGSVRNRLRGGAGGHRGVASVLEAFQTDGFRRVKIGMRPPEAVVDPLEYVLAPIDAASRAAVDVAIAAAGSRVLEMTRRRSSHQSRVGES